jgi:hypothetical protein
LDCYFGHDEHRAVVGAADYVTCSSHQSGSFDVAGALGTFLAGLNFLSLQICFLGLVMALAVPAIAWFKQSALLTLAVVLLIGIGIIFWPRRSEDRATKPG